MTRIGASGVGFGLHNDVVGPYLRDLATEEQKQRWLPGFCSGELITAIAMTEPGAGSDLQGIQTTARKDGDGWVLNGSKTFITNGINADLVIVVARTDPEAPGSKGHQPARRRAGHARLHRAAATWRRSASRRRTPRSCSSTTCGSRPRTCSAPRTAASCHLMENLPQERLSIAVGAVASAETVLALTREYVTSRTAFGKPGRRVPEHPLRARRAAHRDDDRAHLRRRVHPAARHRRAHAPSTRRWPSAGRRELQNKVADRCLQLHGGYGYMDEYPVSKAWRDSRVQSIYGGTNEIMKEIIGRSLGL